MKKRMSKLNEELLRVTGLEEKEKSIKEPVEAVDPTYSDAIDGHKKLKANLEDVFKEQEKNKEDFIKSNEKTELKVKGTPQMKKMKLSESLFEDYIEEATVIETPIEDEFYYSRKREPLADIIMSELTIGEYPVYKLSASGKFNPTNGPCLNIDSENVGANVDDRGEFISARVDSEDQLIDIEKIAKKYNKEFASEFDTYAVGPKYVGKIYIDYQDWDEPYFDPNAKIRTKQNTTY